MGANPITSCITIKKTVKKKDINNNKINNNIDIVQDSIESIEDYGIEIEDKYRGSLAYTTDSKYNNKFNENFNTKFYYKRRKNLIFTNRIIAISQNLNLSEQNIIQIWRFFKTIDPKCIGYITLSQIYFLINESPTNSSIGHIVDRFFLLITKDYTDKVNFEELLPYLVSYCLYSTLHLIEFVFNFIDNNNDKIITRDEIVDFLLIKRDNKLVNIYNHSETIKYTNLINRSDKINFEEFEKLCRRFPFIYYASVTFQNKLKESYISNKFWDSLTLEIADKHVINKKMVEKKKIDVKIEEIQENIIKEKIKVFKTKLNNELDKNKSNANYNNIKDRFNANSSYKKNIKIYEEENRMNINNDNIYYNSYLKKTKHERENNDIIKSLDNIEIEYNIEEELA